MEKLCEENGLSARIIAYYKRNLRKGGETEKRITDIAIAYPRYRFQKDENGLFHNVYIVTIERI